MHVVLFWACSKFSKYEFWYQVRPARISLSTNRYPPHHHPQSGCTNAGPWATRHRRHNAACWPIGSVFPQMGGSVFPPSPPSLRKTSACGSSQDGRITTYMFTFSGIPTTEICSETCCVSWVLLEACGTLAAHGFVFLLKTNSTVF